MVPLTDMRPIVGAASPWQLLWSESTQLFSWRATTGAGERLAAHLRLPYGAALLRARAFVSTTGMTMRLRQHRYVDDTIGAPTQITNTHADVTVSTNGVLDSTTTTTAPLGGAGKDLYIVEFEASTDGTHSVWWLEVTFSDPGPRNF